MGTVCTYTGEEGATEHETAARVAVAKLLAALKGFEFAGDYDRSLPRGDLYFVPSQTLSCDEARLLGIRSEDDLFGGVVPHPFVANKTISHPLAGPGAHAPAGWSETFPASVRFIVLPGFAAFTPQDARRAGALLLQDGPLRIKPGRGIGGKGQIVVERTADLGAALEGVDVDELARHGLVVERNLEEVTTFSVGQVRVEGLRASYCGVQKRTRDNRGEMVYGGSDLLIARGGYEQLQALHLDEAMRTAVRQARTFDAAAAEFEGMFASRRNYDVLRGRDASGRWHCGVLEQSWRIGGASGPEVAALQAFRTDPRLRAVRARSTEAYGAAAEAPRGAMVHFRGIDRRVGPLVKYTVMEPHDPAR